MSSSEEWCCRGLWSCIIGSLRLILFLWTFLCTIVIVFATYFVNRVLVINDSDWTMYLVWNVGLLLPLLICVFGLYGTFFRNAECLKTFYTVLTLLSFLIVVFAFGVFVINYDQDPPMTREMVRQMEKFMHAYKFDSNESKYYPENHLWDEVQTTLGCCGSKSPEDWLDLAQSQGYADRYPRSCCDPPKSNGLCTKEGLHQVGCARYAAKITRIVLIIPAIFAFFHIITALVAYLIRGQILATGHDWIHDPDDLTSSSESQAYELRAVPDTTAHRLTY